MILCTCDINVQCMASGTFLESIPRVLPHVHVHYTCTCTYLCKSIPIVRWQCIIIHVIFLSLVAKPRGCFLAKEDVYLFQARVKQVKQLVDTVTYIVACCATQTRVSASTSIHNTNTLDFSLHVYGHDGSTIVPLVLTVHLNPQ